MRGTARARDSAQARVTRAVRTTARASTPPPVDRIYAPLQQTLHTPDTERYVAR